MCRGTQLAGRALLGWGRGGPARAGAGGTLQEQSRARGRRQPHAQLWCSAAPPHGNAPASTPWGCRARTWARPRGKSSSQGCRICRELSELPKQTVAGRVSSEVETPSSAAPRAPHLPPPPAPRNSAAGVVSISINQLPPDNLGSFKHQYPKRQREGGARWLHLPARSGAAPSPHRHGNGGVMEGRGHSGCRTHEGPFSNHSEGRKAEGNRLLFCRVPASQGERRATAQRWVSPDGKEQEGSCWEVGTTLSPPGPPQHHPPVFKSGLGAIPLAPALGGVGSIPGVLAGMLRVPLAHVRTRINRCRPAVALGDLGLREAGARAISSTKLGKVSPSRQGGPGGEKPSCCCFLRGGEEPQGRR